MEAAPRAGDGDALRQEGQKPGERTVRFDVIPSVEVDNGEAIPARRGPGPGGQIDPPELVCRGRLSAPARVLRRHGRPLLHADALLAERAGEDCDAPGLEQLNRHEDLL